ncbi:MAG: hypothetical protein FJ025_02290 [Chloroflexi bacterium]|nr:hypothetical protein [Chloroflexota bacterium]
MILDIGEKVHIIERSYFPEDQRRHFIGEIIRCTGNTVRVRGHAWVFDNMKGQFVQKREERERVIQLGERIIANVIPRQVNLSEVKYKATERTLIVTDGKSFNLDISEFKTMR